VPLEQRTSHLVSPLGWACCRRIASVVTSDEARTGVGQFASRRCVDRLGLYDARLCPRRGDERLSAKKGSETDGAEDKTRPQKPSASKGKAGKPRSGDLGRALRTIYDDTLRESVPDDFLSLIGKLS
jgi:hypothetical protein